MICTTLPASRIATPATGLAVRLCGSAIRATTFLGLLLALAGTARANLIFSGTGTDSDGSAISATVTFSLTGSQFQVVLANNAVANSQASVLTNLGFNAVPAPATALPSSSGSATLTAGSSIVALGTPDTETVGQEWAYLTGGIASSGFGVGTGSGNLCGTPGCGVMLLFGVGLVSLGAARRYLSSR